MHIARKYMGGRNRKRRGVTVVEVAVAFPILILLVMIVFEIGRMMMVKQCLDYAAQQGCRHASLATTLTQTEVVSSTRDAMQAAISNNSSVVSVAVTPALAGGISSGTPVNVAVQVKLSDVSIVSGNILKHFGDPTLSASAVLDRE
jgi:Flp pilus assembly protein TadG